MEEIIMAYDNTKITLLVLLCAIILAIWQIRARNRMLSFRIPVYGLQVMLRILLM